MIEDKTWDGTSSFRARRYRSYEEYLEHQAAKLRTLNLDGYNSQFKPALKSRIESAKALLGQYHGKSVLCLGARNGIECEAFIEAGFFAVGVDLNPGDNNRYVVHGDFHALQFADRTVDVVFTNALDHAFELPRIIGEIKRVLKPGGFFIAEIVRGSADSGGREPGSYESVWWDHSQTVADQILSLGFGLAGREAFEYPWVGDQWLFASQPAKR